MKIYFVRVTEGDSSGGVAGPTSDIGDILTYSPPDQYDGKLVQVLEAEEGDPEKAIYDWCWKTDEWIPTSRKLSLVFGSTAEPLIEQLAGFGFDEKKIAHWQKDADAIARLGVRGILSHAEMDKARKKLMNRIARNE